MIYLGKVILSQCAAADFERILTYRDEHQCLIREAERAVLKVTHQEIGKWVSDVWNLPKEISAVMQYHHHPHLAGSHEEICSIVHLADILCRSLCVGSGGDLKIPVIEEIHPFAPLR